MNVKYEYQILYLHSMLKSYHLKTFQFLSLPPPHFSCLYPSFPFSFFFAVLSLFLEYHFPHSFHQKKVMFLLRRIPFSTHHTPVRKKGSLTNPSLGLTWLWLVAMTYQAFFQKPDVSYFAFQNILKKSTIFFVRYYILER